MNYIQQCNFRYAKLIFLLAGVCFIASTGNLLAFEKNKTLHEWYNHYYLHQDNRRLVAAISYFYSADFPASDLKKMSIQGFFGALFQQHPRQAIKWVTRSRLSAVERRPLLVALSSAGLTKQAMKWAKQDNWSSDDLSRLNHPEMPLEPAKLVITRDINIGFLWGAFKASGNKRYLDKIIDTLLPRQPGSTNNPSSESIIIMAIKTLHHNRANDSLVDDYYLARYENMGTKTQQELDILFADHEGEDDSLDCD